MGIFVRSHFAEILCKCPNGTPQTDNSLCTKHGASLCKECNTGWTINKGKTKCEGVYTAYESLALNLDPKCASMTLAPRDCSSYRHLYWLLHTPHVCLLHPVNVCKCKHGTPRDGIECTSHDAPMCQDCDAGWDINPQKTACIGALIISIPVV